MNNTNDFLMHADDPNESIDLRDVVDPVEEEENVRAILIEDLEPTSPTFGAMSLGSLGFQIASERTGDDSDWKWTTFGNAQGFNADLITAGTLNAININGSNISGGTIIGTVINNGGGTFKVDGDGMLTATSAVISGSITGSTISGGTITGSTISGGTITGSSVYGGVITGPSIVLEENGALTSYEELEYDGQPNGWANLELNRGSLSFTGETAIRGVTPIKASSLYSYAGISLSTTYTETGANDYVVIGTGTAILFNAGVTSRSTNFSYSIMSDGRLIQQVNGQDYTGYTGTINANQGFRVVNGIIVGTA